MSTNILEATAFAPPVPNMLSEWPQRQRNAPSRPGFVPITHADMPSLTDVEVNAVTDYETRQDSRDLNFMTPPVPPQASDSSGITVALHRSRAPDTRSPTLGARDKTPEELAVPQRPKGKRRESITNPSRQTPPKRQRQNDNHDLEEYRQAHAQASSSTKHRYEYDSEEITVLGHGMVTDILACTQTTSTQTQSTDEQPATPASLAEQEVDDYFLASYQDRSTASESGESDKDDSDIDELDTAYIRRKCILYDKNKEHIDQCRHDRERLCRQLNESLSPRVEAANLDAVRKNREVIEGHSRVSEQLHNQIANAIKVRGKEGEISLPRHDAIKSEALDTDAIRRLCDGYDKDRRKIEQLVEHQKHIVKKLARHV